VKDLIAVLRTIAVLSLGFAMSPASAAIFVYVGNSESQDVSVFQLKDNGDLVPVATVAVPGPTPRGGSLPLAVSLDRKFLYAGLRNQPYSVVTFSIDAKTGKLTYAGTGPLVDSMAYIVTDRSGRFLLAASYDGNRVTVSPIGPGGVVGPTRQIVPTLPHAHCILPDPQNLHVLHTSLGGDVVYQGTFDANTGRLSPGDPPAVSVNANSGPRHLVFSPRARFVYVIGELDGSIYVFPYDQKTGLRAHTQVVSSLPTAFSGKPWAADLHLTPDGKLLYASERTSSTLAAFRVDSDDGTLKAIGSFPTARQPRSFNIDPSGRYLVSAGQLSNTVIVHSIDKASGKPVILREWATGQNPTWVEAVEFP
jgi:6-phosphogluconolactonase